MALHLNLIERFPEYQDRVKNLLETNTTFASLAQRYADVLEQVRDASDETGPETERLRRRQQDLETEMLSIIEEKSRP